MRWLESLSQLLVGSGNPGVQWAADTALASTETWLRSASALSLPVAQVPLAILGALLVV